jgi:CDP-diacylglycerol--glycerol-3-phosphate 3-phosphatidyltransferase
MTGRLPHCLIAFRAACAPLLFVLACFGAPGSAIAAILMAALLSDIFDGVIARRLGIATPALRRADTMVDTLFYCAAGLAVWTAVPGAFGDVRVALPLLVLIHISRATFEIAKFGRVAAYHMWSSKLLGLLLAGGMMLTFVTGRPSIVLLWGVRLAVANELEGFALSAILPAWQADVPSLAHGLSAAMRSRPRGVNSITRG